MPSLVTGASVLSDKSNQNLGLPATFKCRIGGEWKPSSGFSNKQLAKWHSAQRSRNSRVTPASIGLTCREHSGEPSNVLECHGPCGLWKSRDNFSNTQRRNNRRWCVACTQWQLEQDYDTVPLAAPNEVNEAADENEGFTNAPNGVVFGQETEDGFDGDEANNVIFSSARSAKTSRPGFSDDGINSDDDGDEGRVGTDEDDHGGPHATSVRHGHFFGDDDSGSDSDDASPPYVTESNVTSTETRPKAHTAAPSAARAAASIPAQPQDSHVRRPLTGSGQQEVAEAWIPPHLLQKENLMTLRETNLVERHMPSYSQTLSTASMASYSGQPQSRAGPPRGAGFSTQSAASVSFRTTERGFQPSVAMPSVITSDSRAGLQPTTNTTAMTSTGNPQAHGHRANEPGISGPSTPSAQPMRYPIDRAKVAKGNFARIDQRKDFGQRQRQPNRSGTDHVVVYDSGSDDSF